MPAWISLEDSAPRWLPEANTSGENKPAAPEGSSGDAGVTDATTVRRQRGCRGRRGGRHAVTSAVGGVGAVGPLVPAGAVADSSQPDADTIGELKAYPHLPIAFSVDSTRRHAPLTGSRPTLDSVRADEGAMPPCAQAVGAGATGTVVRSLGTATDAVVNWPPGTTSVMLRNIPNRYTPEKLLEEMVLRGFEGAFDFFYLPTDFSTKKNKGYGFLNLRSPELAQSFRRAFDRQQLTRYPTQKVLVTSPSMTQGFRANVVKYLKNQAERVQNPWFRPMIFVPNEGRGSPWRCVSLCKEHLPESMLHLLAEAGPPGGGRGRPGDRTARERSAEFLAPSLEDIAESEASAASDTETTLAMQAAVSEFLRGCRDTGRGALDCTH